MLGIFTMIIGVFGAASQFEIRSILSFHIVSQIGYMILGLGLFSELAWQGALFPVHNMMAKSNLFLISGVIGRLKGTTQLKELGGSTKKSLFSACSFCSPPWHWQDCRRSLDFLPSCCWYGGN